MRLKLTETTTPIWFGPDKRPLLGWVHAPSDRRARGAVVLCPPLGIELSHSQHMLRLLARSLQAAGFITIRFDYDGTGQSAGDLNDPNRVDALIESVAHAVTLARTAGAERVAGVGLRLGATVLAQAAAESGAFESLVLWDPCVSGSTFLRDQVALWHAVCPVDSATESGSEILGYHLASETARDLARLHLPEADTPLADRVLVLTDPARGGNARLSRHLDQSAVEWQEYCDHDGAVFDIGLHDYQPARGVIEQMVSWLRMGCDRQPVSLQPVRGNSTSAVVARSEDGRPVVETLVRLGPSGLFGIACEMPEADPPSGERITILLLSLAAESSIGPVRQWVELSRYWAAAGYRCVRFDLSGIGESPVRDGQPEGKIYGPRALDDICEAAHAMSPGGAQNVVLVGVCSGAYEALAIAPRLRPRGVVAANPALYFAAFEHARKSHRPPSGAPAASLVTHKRGIMSGPKRIRTSLRSRLPRSAYKLLWTLIYKLRLSHSPARLIRPLIESQVPALLLCGELEARPVMTRTPRVIERLERDSLSQFVTVPGLDHSIRNRSSQTAFRDATTRFLDELSVTGAGATKSAGASPERHARTA